MVNSRIPNQCVRNVASLQYRLYVILCVMLIKWLGGKKLRYMGMLGVPRSEKVIVLEQTKIGQQFFRRHATRAPHQVFY